MKFEAPVASFIKPLQQLSALAGGAANPDDIVNNILISVKDNRLFLRATDYRIELSYTTEVTAYKDGETTVNANKIREACSRLDQAAVVLFTYEPMDEVLILQSGSTIYRVRTRDPKDFPVMESEEFEDKLELRALQLKTIIDRSVFCIANDDFREYLRGMRLEVEGDRLTVFTSDGHRMSINEAQLQKPFESSYGVTLIKPCATELSKILQTATTEDEMVTLEFSRNLISTTFNNFKLTSKLLICNYPNVRSVIPKEFAVNLSVEREALRQSISRVSVLSSKRINGVTLNFDKGILNLKTENAEHEVATDTIPLNYDGETFEISLNASYVQDVLNSLSYAPEVCFLFQNVKSLANTMMQAATADESGVKTGYFIARVVV